MYTPLPPLDEAARQYAADLLRRLAELLPDAPPAVLERLHGALEPAEERLDLDAAADVLGVHPEFLAWLLDAKALPYTRQDGAPAICPGDLPAIRAAAEAELEYRLRTLDELDEYAAEIGLYSDAPVKS